MPDTFQQPRRFQCTTEGHNKFWNIAKFHRTRLGGAFFCFQTRWGRIGTSGTTNEREFFSALERDVEYYKLIRQKQAKGYREVVSIASEILDRAELTQPPGTSIRPPLIVSTQSRTAGAGTKEPKPLDPPKMKEQQKEDNSENSDLRDRIKDLELD